MKKGKTKRLLALLCALALAVAATACGAGGADTPPAETNGAAEPAAQETEASTAQEAGEESAPQAADDAITLLVGSNTAPSHPENAYLNKLAELVLEKSGGSIIIDVKDSATIGDHLERLEGLKLGTVDGSMTSIGFLGGYDSVFNIFEMPYLFRDEAHQHAFFHGEAFDKMAAETQKYGFILVGATEMGARHITNSVRPIETPEDLAGLKIRVPETKSSMDALTAMGATPTPMAFSELYMGLQQNQVDGQENPFSTIYASKFHEVQSYLSLTGHQRVEQILLLSELTWNKLSAEQQDIIWQAEAEANAFVQQVVADEESEMLQLLQEGGLAVNEVDQALFMEKVAYLRAEYLEEYGEAAQEYFDMIDAL